MFVKPHSALSVPAAAASGANRPDCLGSRAATAEKGSFVFDAWSQQVVRRMRAIKADEVTPRLEQDFHLEAERSSLD